RKPPPTAPIGRGRVWFGNEPPKPAPIAPPNGLPKGPWAANCGRYPRPVSGSADWVKSWFPFIFIPPSTKGGGIRPPALLAPASELRSNERRGPYHLRVSEV